MPRNAPAAGDRSPDLRMLASALVAVAMLAGFATPHLAELAAPLVYPALFVLALASLMPSRNVLCNLWRRIDGALMAKVMWLQVALPLLVLSIGVAVGLPDRILALFLISATASIVFASPAIAQIIGLDRTRITQAMIATTCAMPLSLYIFLQPFVPLEDHEMFVVYVERVALFLVIPMVIVAISAFALRGASDSLNVAIDSGSHWLSVFALGIFAIGITDGVAEAFAAHPGRILAMSVGVIGLSAFMYFTTRIVFARLGEARAHLAGISSMTRNVGISYAIVGHLFGPELALYVALCQLPSLCLPLVLRMLDSEPQSPAVEAAEQHG